ncbi:MAG: hypothetical protein AM325_016070 [Candidatus Thorarchaeota archaeon SMTZ1-45]|nr:MAG: hypothetical protein AM325_16865 [Candidatus Thorarchaeota archaeon SMTZ1-45]
MNYDKNYLQQYFAFHRIRRLYKLSEGIDKELKNGLERKKEQARKRAKAVRESAIIARRRGERSLTPGVKVIGSSVLDREAEKVDFSETGDELEEIVASYLLKKGGFQITDEQRLDSISTKRDSEDVMEVQIARIMGLHEQWGPDRRFLSKSIYAHLFENGAVFEHSLISYGGFVSRTYYVVDGNEFRAFAQRNFRKPPD